MTSARPYVDQDTYRLLANKTVLNQGKVDIFHESFKAVHFDHFPYKFVIDKL